MKIAVAMLTVLVGLMVSSVAYPQSRNDRLENLFNQCLKNVDNIDRAYEWKSRYCDCFAHYELHLNTSVGLCMRTTAPKGTEHEPGYTMLYCTETWKEPAKPDYYNVFKTKYFLPPGRAGEALICTDAWDRRSCTSVGAQGPQRSWQLDAGDEQFTFNPPYHRLTQRNGNAVARVIEGPCQLYGADQAAWPDYSDEPTNRAVEVVCTQQGGPNYCVPGHYAPDDPAFIDKARIEREDLARANRGHSDFAGCMSASQPEMARELASVYCNCLNMKMGRSRTTSLLDWMRTNPSARAECKQTAETFVGSRRTTPR